jgi:hypothetical protein
MSSYLKLSNFKYKDIEKIFRTKYILYLLGILCLFIIILIILKSNYFEGFEDNKNKLIGLNKCDGIVYINLENREDRKKLFLDEIKKIGIDESKLHKVSGVYIPKNGHKGCAHSHYLALLEAKKLKWKNVLILEDDFHFTYPKEIVQLKLSQLLNNLQKIPVDGSRIVYVSESVFQKLNIDKKLPFVRIEDISNAKSNPTFIASKAEIFQEERKVSNTSKVNNVEIAPLSSTESKKTELISKKIYLQFGSFYYSKFANELRNNLINSLKVINIAIEGGSKNYYVTIGPISNIKVYDSLYYKLKQNNYDGFKILVK